MFEDLPVASPCKCCGKPLSPFYPAVQDPQTREVFRLDRCDVCDHVQTEPQPVDLGPYYGDRYHGGRHGIMETICMSRRLRFTNSVARRGSLLDFGCGDGGFLARAQSEGWDVTGVEVKPEHARARGLRIRESLDEVEGAFDVITLWHSLEHVKDPRETLARLTRLLKDDGVVLIAVPNRTGLQARLFGPGWFHLDPPRHLGHFSPASLSGLLSRAGLEIVRRWNLEFEIDLFGWTQSALNRIIRVPNVLFDVVTHRGRPHSASDVVLSLLAGSVVTALCLPFVLYTAAVGDGGIMIVAARRREATAA